ncbi:hypothetical protein ABW21_db0202903 [Orbilia brochopaga]|nr:hypothetical protein ABW21_db0202903 [Drechslerella brochopaga]
MFGPSTKRAIETQFQFFQSISREISSKIPSASIFLQRADFINLETIGFVKICSPNTRSRSLRLHCIRVLQLHRPGALSVGMRIQGLLTTAFFLRVVTAQTSDSIAGNASSTTTSDSTDTSSTTTTSDTLVTLAPDACLTAGLESCYNILQIIAPTVYVILTLTESSVPESLSGEETITSGDPILTQTENILTATDEQISPPVTAVVRVSYTESSGTTCDDATITSTLTNSDDEECAQSTVAFFTPPPQVTKTRVFIKAKEDDTQRKGTDGGGDNIVGPTNQGGGDGSSPNTSRAAPTDAAQPTNDRNEPVLSPTDGGSPTGGGSPPENGSPTGNSNGSPTENGSPASTGGAPRPTENQTGTNYIPSSTKSAEPENPGTVGSGTSEQTPSNSPVSSPDSPPDSPPDSSSNSSSDSSPDSPSSPTDSTPPSPNDSNPTLTGSLTTLVSGRPSSGTRTTGAGQNEAGKSELTTSYTTIAEVSNGSTRFVTSAVATMTRSSSQPQGTGGASPNNIVKAELLFGAFGLAAVLGL